MTQPQARILVVDDERNIRRTLGMVLETAGYQVDSSKTAVVILTAYGSVANAVEAMKLGAVDFLEKPFDPKLIRLLTEEILLRQRLGAHGSVEELLHLADLARKRKDSRETRAYLKTAMLHDPGRPEPYYWLGFLHEDEGNTRQALHYYYMALDVHHTFQLALDALARLGVSLPQKQ